MPNYNLDIYHYAEGYVIVEMIIPEYSNYRFFYKYVIEKKKKPKKYLSYILILLFILMPIFLKTDITRKNYEEIYQEYYKPYTMSINFRCDDEKSFQFDKNTNLFLCAITKQKEGNINSAIEYYKEVIKNNNNLYVEQSKWYLGLCYLKNHQIDNAYKEFKELSENKGYYQLKAKRLLNKLK